MRLSRNKVLLLLVDKNMNQSIFADSIGISRSTLSQYMNGKTARPQILNKLAKALGVNVTEIIED